MVREHRNVTSWAALFVRGKAPYMRASMAHFNCRIVSSALHAYAVTAVMAVQANSALPAGVDFASLYRHVYTCRSLA
jgi:hypothetical protein